MTPTSKNALVTFDSRGIFHLFGGAGPTDGYPNAGDLNFGYSAGAGIAVPSRLLPVTLGLTMTG